MRARGAEPMRVFLILAVRSGLLRCVERSSMLCERFIHMDESLFHSWRHPVVALPHRSSGDNG